MAGLSSSSSSNGGLDLEKQALEADRVRRTAARHEVDEVDDAVPVDEKKNRSRASSRRIRGVQGNDVESEDADLAADDDDDGGGGSRQQARSRRASSHGDVVEVLDEGGDGSEDDNGDGPGVVGRVLSRMTSRSSYDPGPPPDGGWLAWSQCLSAHIVIMNTWGWINSFGTFQTYYADTLSLSPSAISWLGSISVFLLFFIGTFTGRLVDAGYFRPVFLTGSVLLVGGIFAVSWCTAYWHLLLAQGLCMGLANGCLFCPTLATLSTYFARRRSLVLGIAAAGSVTGGLVFPVIVRQLLPQIGFPWTIRVIGFIQMGGMVVANCLTRPRVRPRKAGPLVDWASFKQLDYTFYAAGAFFCFWGLYFAFFYLASFARQAIDPALSYVDSLNLLLVLNGIGVFGRIVPNYLADRVGPLNVMIPTAAATSLVLLCWIAVGSPPGLYAWSAVYGIVAGGIQGLFPAGLSSLTADLRKAGVRMGMVFTIVSFAVLTGPPIAGAIVGDGGRKGYDGAQAFAGAVVAVGLGFMVAAKRAKMGKTGMGWMGKM